MSIIKNKISQFLWGFAGVFFMCVSVGVAKQLAHRPITVMTLNLANYHDHANWEERATMIADEIQKTHADIITLQETRFDPDQPSTQRTYQDMAQQILYRLNKRGDFLNASIVTQPAMYYPDRAQAYPLPAYLSPTHQSSYWEGLSVISRIPIQETGSVFLSMPANCHDANQRNTQYVKVENNGKPLYIANIHFAYDEPCTLSNARETMAYFNAIVKDQPMIMLGDYNATPNSPIFPLLSAQGMTDMWLKLRPQEAGNTATASNPIKRIDYIMANAAAINAMQDKEEIELVCDKPQSGLYCSDHLGVALTF